MLEQKLKNIHSTKHASLLFNSIQHQILILCNLLTHFDILPLSGSGICTYFIGFAAVLPYTSEQCCSAVLVANIMLSWSPCKRHTILILSLETKHATLFQLQQFLSYFIFLMLPAYVCLTSACTKTIKLMQSSNFGFEVCTDNFPSMTYFVCYNCLLVCKVFRQFAHIFY